tara:strand:- start:1059 stop:2741 length:1683 start_codon:yes stop_codon:yes gene_type:complete
MGLISLNGANPFEGQVDPFVGFEVNYDSLQGDTAKCDNNPSDQKMAVYSLSLNGTVTGCDFDSLTTARNSIKSKFTPNLVSTFTVDGLNLPTDDVQINVESINFPSASYIGHLPYSINLSIHKRLKEAAKIINKTHTLDFNIPAQGEKTVRYRIGAQGVETGDCSGLQNAVDWVNKNILTGNNGNIENLLQYNAIGKVKNPAQVLSLTSQGETVNRAESSYERNYSFTAGPDGVTSIIHDYSVTETSAELGCDDPNYDKSYRGTFTFKSTDPNAEEVVLTTQDKEDLINEFWDYYDGIFTTRDRPFSTSLNTGNGTLSYTINNPNSATEDETVIYDETLSTDMPTNGDITYSVNGSAFIKGGSQSGNKTTLDAITNDELLTRMTSLAGGDVEKKSFSVERNDIDGTISYNATFKKETVQNSSDLFGQNGLTSYNIDMTVPVHAFATPYVLGKDSNNEDCNNIVLDLDYVTRASINIRAQGISGSGFLGTTASAIESNLQDFVAMMKAQIATSPTQEQNNAGTFDISEEGCASYSKSFSWNTTNGATSRGSPTSIISDLLG